MIRSSFFGIEIAKTGLFTSQKGLDVTAHNIANVDTLGYTRQRLVTTAIDPYNSTVRFIPVERGLVGEGVKVQYLDQIRSAYLDKKYRQEQSDYSNWATRTQGLNYVETLFDEDDEYSLRATLVSFLSSFDAIVQNPSDIDQRTYVKSQAELLISNMKHVYNNLVDMHTDQNEAVKTTVAGINSITEQIAALNKSIKEYERTGEKANDLRDKRNLLVDQLSALIDIDYEEDANNNFILRTGDGVELVNHLARTEIVCDTAANPVTGASDLYIPSVLDSNGKLAALTVNGGELKGHLDLRDNDKALVASDGVQPGIPYFIDQLNLLAQAIVKEVNDLHKQGYTLPIGGNASQSGVAFFDEPRDPVTGLVDYTLVTAGDLRLSDEVIASVYNIAASDEPVDLDDAGTAKAGNQEIAKKLAALVTNMNLDDIGSFNGFISSIVTDLSTTLNHSKNMQKTQYALVLGVDNQRLSVSGVSLDEEMTNLLKFQHAFNGASRVITTMDEALETIINKMGLVGRS